MVAINTALDFIPLNNRVYITDVTSSISAERSCNFQSGICSSVLLIFLHHHYFLLFLSCTRLPVTSFPCYCQVSLRHHSQLKLISKHSIEHTCLIYVPWLMHWTIPTEKRFSSTQLCQRESSTMLKPRVVGVYFCVLSSEHGRWTPECRSAVARLTKGCQVVVRATLILLDTNRHVSPPRVVVMGHDVKHSVISWYKDFKTIWNRTVS